jgi:hypothetical protein
MAMSRMERDVLWRINWRSNNLFQAVLAGHSDIAYSIAREIAGAALGLSEECIASELARMTSASLKKGFPARLVPPARPRVDRVLVAKFKGGRKPRADTASQCRLSIRLTWEERAAVEEAAKANHVCIAEVLREAVNEYVADYGAPRVFQKISAHPRSAAS